jgi:hypothetical protein
MQKEENVLILVNHVQEGYLNSKDPKDVELKNKILNFVEEAREHANNVAWSYARNSSPTGLPFDIAKERPATYQKNDLTLTNNNGKGTDSNFLQDVYDAKPDHIILVGVFFEACSAGTATTIKESMDVKISVPMDMTNPPEPPFEDHYKNVQKQLQSIGIDVKSSSTELLNGMKKTTAAKHDAQDHNAAPTPNDEHDINVPS